MAGDKVKVLVVEDLLVVRKFLVDVLSADPELEVIGAVADGQAAVEFVEQRRPDVITMDIVMPRVNGFEATRRIMETHPVPIVIVSGSYAPHEVAKSFAAVEAGAVAILPRPTGVGSTDEGSTAEEFVRTVKAMAQVKVVRRWAKRGPSAAADREPEAGGRLRTAEVVAIGASTGGPQVLQRILSGLPADFPVPIVIVQHIAIGFGAGFAEWLDGATSLAVRLGADREVLRPGTVYVAPDDCQMAVVSGGRLKLTDDPPECSLRPSVSYLFRSVAETYGPQAVGVLLTGMGRDGADGLLLMKERKAITIAQDEASSVVHGMPGEAIRLGAACHVMAPEMIVQALKALAMRAGGGVQ